MADVSSADALPGPAQSGGEALWRAVRSVLAAQRKGPALVPAPRDSPPPASFAQQRLYYLEALDPGTPVYNQTVAYRMVGTLDVDALERSAAEIVRRHEALRTTLASVDGTLVQIIHAPGDVTIPLVDLAGGVAAGDTLDTLTLEEARRPFDLHQAPLLRLRLFRTGPQEHRLALTVHHLAFDGWSFDVLMRELATLYAAFVAGAPSPLAPLPVQYADVALWQRERLDGETREALLAYWTNQLRAPRAEVALPAERWRRNVRVRSGALQAALFPKSLSEALRRLAGSEGATPFMLLLAGFQILLHRYAGEDDIVVGSPIANRGSLETEKLIGLLVNTLALRTSLAGQPSVCELLARTRDTVLGAYAHQELPFEMLVEALAPQRRADAPLFRVMFAYQNVPRSAWTLPGIAVEAWNVDNGTTKFDLTLYTWDTDAGLHVLLEYDTGLYSPQWASDLVGHFRNLLDAIARDPGARIAALPMLSPQQSRAMLDLGRGPDVGFPRDASVHRFFEAQVDRTPDAVALAFDGGELRYGELDARANRLARHLRSMGVGPGMSVAVDSASSPALIVALLAILKAGAAYVPIDPAAPQARRRLMLEGTRVVAIVTEGREAGAEPVGVHRVDLARHARRIDALSDGRLDVDATGESPAFVMFTSGSTGAPKGVSIPHRGVIRLVVHSKYADLGPGEVFVQLAPVSFDASTFEIWGALLNGSRLVLLDDPRPSLAAIAQAIRRFDVSILWLTSGLFEAVVDACPDALAGVRQLLIGGDVVSVPHVRRFSERFGDCRLVNCYGPTENTTFTTFHPVDPRSDGGDDPIPVGRPIVNTQVYVLDPLLQPVPFGVPGEAYIGGDGVMLGYVGDEAAQSEGLTAIPPHLAHETSRGVLYRTGDIVRYRRDGNLEFLGRRDRQTKIRGFRIEPGEIESALRASPDVRQAAVAVRDAAGERRLIAYIVPHSPPEPRAFAGGLRVFLRTRLPDYLIPAEFVVCESLPLTAIGKVDRSALPADERAAVLATAAVAPRDDVERKVAQAFAEILGVRSVGVHDDFFDLGGSSLGALRAVARLEDAFSLQLPLSTLYEHPVVELLAARLRDLAAAEDASTLMPADDGAAIVTLKRAEGSAPRMRLFLVPGGHGGKAEMTLYARLATYLARDLAVYGLLARGVDGPGAPHANVPEMARAYVAEMRAQQPEGPYALAGECIGGVVAFEMAQQLVAEGERVSLLLLIDTWLPTALGRLHYRYVERPRAVLHDRRVIARRGVAEVRRVLDDHIRSRPRGKPLRSLRYAVNVALTLKRVAKPWMAAVRDVGRAAPVHADIAAAESSYIAQTLRYAPRPYPGRVALLASASNARLGIGDGWRHLAGGGFALYPAPGNHDTYLRDHPAAAAAVLAKCIADATTHRRFDADNGTAEGP